MASREAWRALGLGSVEIPACKLFFVNVFDLDDVLGELATGQREGGLLSALLRVVLDKYFACQG